MPSSPPSPSTRFAVFLVALALARPAAALDCPEEAPDDPAARRTLAKKWFGDAQQRQSDGDELGALRAYQCSLRLVPHAFTAYNLGKLAEKTGDLELAVDSYRAYLKLTPEAPDAASLEARIVELESRIADLQSLKHPSRPEPPPPVEHKPPPPPVEHPPRVAQPKPAEGPVQPATEGERSHTWAWVAMGGGTALLGTGIVFNVMSRSKMDEFNRLWAEGGAHDAEANAAYDKARTYAYTSYALLWTGGAIAATGVALFFWPRSSNGASTEAHLHDTRLAVAPLSDGAAVFAVGRF